MHNSFQFIGNLTRDAVLSGQVSPTVGTLELAVDRVWRSADGQKQSNTDFFRIKCFDALAVNAQVYLGKGSLVFVQGYIKPTRYEKDGQTVYGHDFIANKIDYLKTVAPSQGEDGQPAK